MPLRYNINNDTEIYDCMEILKNVKVETIIMLSNEYICEFVLYYISENNTNV
jgi:hypothetical protein